MKTTLAILFVGLALAGCVTTSTEQQIADARTAREGVDRLCQQKGYRPGTHDFAMCQSIELNKLAMTPNAGNVVAGTAVATMGAAAAAAMPLLIFSDIRLKRDIVRVGEEGSFVLYRFRYLWSDQEYVGVMADDVAAVRPDAVLRGQDGFLRVHYNALGITFRTWEDWIAAGQN